MLNGSRAFALTTAVTVSDVQGIPSNEYMYRFSGAAMAQHELNSYRWQLAQTYKYQRGPV